jgi:hypothetical protein
MQPKASIFWICSSPSTWSQKNARVSCSMLLRSNLLSITLVRAGHINVDVHEAPTRGIILVALEMHSNRLTDHTLAPQDKT